MTDLGPLFFSLCPDLPQIQSQNTSPGMLTGSSLQGQTRPGSQKDPVPTRLVLLPSFSSLKTRPKIQDVGTCPQRAKKTLTVLTVGRKMHSFKGSLLSITVFLGPDSARGCLYAERARRMVRGDNAHVPYPARVLIHNLSEIGTGSGLLSY